jgi:ribosomal protein L37E
MYSHSPVHASRCGYPQQKQLVSIHWLVGMWKCSCDKICKLCILHVHTKTYHVASIVTLYISTHHYSWQCILILQCMLVDVDTLSRSNWQVFIDLWEYESARVTRFANILYIACTHQNLPCCVDCDALHLYTPLQLTVYSHSPVHASRCGYPQQKQLASIHWLVGIWKCSCDMICKHFVYCMYTPKLTMLRRLWRSTSLHTITADSVFSFSSAC